MDDDVGETVSYSLTVGDNVLSGGLFSIDSATGVVTVASNADPSRIVQDDIHTLYVSATDSSGLSSLCEITLTIIDANFPPVISVPSISAIGEVSESAAAGTVMVASLQATDSDGHAFTWHLDEESLASAGLTGAFAINSASGEITIQDSSNVDFESALVRDGKRVVPVYVLARDNGPG